MPRMKSSGSEFLMPLISRIVEIEDKIKIAVK